MSSKQNCLTSLSSTEENIFNLSLAKFGVVCEIGPNASFSQDKRLSDDEI